jgi:hypothetical protein
MATIAVYEYLCCIVHVWVLSIVEVQMVKQMPTIAANQQPTIAIITANYCEKLAVDAMMENKTTFVKYKAEGMKSVVKYCHSRRNLQGGTFQSKIGHVPCVYTHTTTADV